MKKLADDVYVLEGFPPYAINVYLLGDVLIDAATRFASAESYVGSGGRKVSTHALTHAHPDHQGASHAICERLGIPLWCGEADADAMEQPGEIMARMPKHWLSGTIGRSGPVHHMRWLDGSARATESGRSPSSRRRDTPRATSHSASAKHDC